MAKPKYNPDTMKKIITVLASHAEGIWLSRLAREAELPVSTTAYYLNNQLRPLIKEHSLGGDKKIIRVVSLKPQVLQRLVDGKDLGDILKLMNVISDYT